jgi:uncharacterized repeat protein (TIGR03847 family)
MPVHDIDLEPITHITTDAIGDPGNRVFYIQGWQDERTVTLIVEKVQIQTLAVGLEQFLAEIEEKFPELEEASADYDEDKMHITPPVDPLFRVGELGLGYDTDRDLVVLITRELVAEDLDVKQDVGQEEDQEENSDEIHEKQKGSVVRFWCSRMQIRAMCRWGIEVTSRGRPLCPQCGQPMDSKGHFCPKKNGHKH